jgi:hypothetical protein
MGCSSINHLFWGIPIYGNPYVFIGSPTYLRITTSSDKKVNNFPQFPVLVQSHPVSPVSPELALVKHVEVQKRLQKISPQQPRFHSARIFEETSFG